MRWLTLVALVVLAAQCAPVLRGPFACDGVQIVSDELTVPEADAYCRRAVRERRKVEAFWGLTWTEPLRVHVSSTYRISRALVPGHLGNRGFIEMPLRRAREDTGALLHEIVHVYAPHDNRFLAEGLAVYLFEGFLIERHGLAAFRTLYETGDYQRAYGRSFGALEHEWRVSLGETPPVR